MSLAIEALLDGEAEVLPRKAVDMALQGDTTALRLCLKRVCPAPKGAPVRFELSPISSAEDAARAAGAVLSAVSVGELTPIESASVMGLVETCRHTLELTEIERRSRSWRRYTMARHSRRVDRITKDLGGSPADLFTRAGAVERMRRSRRSSFGGP